MKQQIKTAFQYMLDYNAACAACPKNCCVVPMRGWTRMKDFYLFVPKKILFFRSANSGRYGEYKSEMFMDGQFIGACRIDKQEKIQALYESGYLHDAREYALGYRLWRETEMGGKKINPGKERARISHILCEASGKAGHEHRQFIRQNLHILNY